MVDQHADAAAPQGLRGGRPLGIVGIDLGEPAERLQPRQKPVAPAA